jgi:hypothetical protein
MKTKAAEADAADAVVEFARKLQREGIKEGDMEKLRKMAGYKVYRVGVTQKGLIGRITPTRNRRAKQGTYLTANAAAILVGWSRGLFVRHVQNNVPEMTPEYGVIIRKRRRRKTVWVSRALLKQLFPDSIKG